MTRPVKKAVFPVAGFGTRFLPATKANPKEMLPIVDKPLIQYAVEEAISAGITQLIFVTSQTKRAIEDHFDSNYELEAKLAERAKYDLLALVQGILPKGVSCIYVRQPEQLGLGHAVMCAKDVVGDEPFAVLLADDLMDGQGNKPCMVQMVDEYNKTMNSVIAVQEVLPCEVEKYGIVALAAKDGDSQHIANIVEKPSVKDAPSNLAVVGRYILTPRIFHFIAAIGAGAVGEIQLTDAIAGLLSEEEIQVCRFNGKRYDCGSKLGYLEATVEYALKHPEVGREFGEYLEARYKS
ncbi:MAG: UTP--glucose-1-phosphate uridylyltransferase GalU [Gammaproteobacteria bacterium]|nr:UTP--glucose-1-phosphate uridylyltransferase GalU [Gammaproteobacteria bacterium]